MYSPNKYTKPYRNTRKVLLNKWKQIIAHNTNFMPSRKGKD
jgi:hypothetical protein